MATQGAAVVAACSLASASGLLPVREAVATAAACLVLLLPILSVVSLAEDAVNGYGLMAASRLVTVTTLFGGLLGGITAAGLAVRDWSVTEDARNVHFVALSVVVVLVASAVGAAGNAVFNGGGYKLLPSAVGAGLLAGGCGLGLRSGLSVPPVPAAFLAAVVLAAAATLTARRLRITPSVMILSGITGALLPGPAAFQSLAEAAAHSGGAGASFAGALLITAALGVGTVLGTTLGTRILIARAVIRPRPASAAGQTASTESAA